MRELPFEIRLAEFLRIHSPFGIAFSGGADSTALAVFAAKHRKPGEVILIHAETPFGPPNERLLVRETARRYRLPLEILPLDVLSVPEIAANGSMRCYHCKKLILTHALELLKRRGISSLCDGANLDDLSDWRPGMKAAAELGILHPFLEARMGKRQIRLTARRLGIANWMMPASACAASRIPCGTLLCPDDITLVMTAEQILREEFSFADIRVRLLPGRHASLEVKPIHRTRLSRLESQIRERLLPLGFCSLSIQPSGYRRGAMNRPEPK